jgi:hypothetical protein
MVVKRYVGGVRFRGRNSRGQALVEFLGALLVLFIPCMVGVFEVYRVELGARHLLFDAQKQCIQDAVRANVLGRKYIRISVNCGEKVEILPATKRLFPTWRPYVTELHRRYYIGTGTNHL